MIAVAILRRRLREGKTYEDFRKAWFHEDGFNAPNWMFSILNINRDRGPRLALCVHTDPA